MGSLVRLYKDAFSGLSGELYILAAALFVNRCGTMVLAYLTLYLTGEQGFSETSAGQVLAVYGIGAVVGIFIGGQLVDRLGFRWVQVGALIGSGAAFIGFGYLPPGSSLYLGAGVLGLVAESFRPANGAAVSAYSQPSNRARAFGLNRLALNLGWTVGPLIGGYLATRDYRLLFWIDGLTCMLAGVLLAVFLPPLAQDTPAQDTPAQDTPAQDTGAPARGAPASPANRSPWRDRVFLAFFALVLLQALVFFQIQSTWPLYLHDVRGLSTVWIGRLLVVNAGLIVLFEMPLVRLLEGRNPLTVIALSSLLIGLGFGLLPLSGAVPFLVALVVVWTVGEMLLAPTSMAWVASRAGERGRGAYFAAYGINFSLAVALAPLIGTRVYERLGPETLWAGCLGLGVVTMLGLVGLARAQPQ